MITWTQRSTIVGSLLLKAGMVKQNEAHKELKPSRVRRDNEDLSKLIKGTCETMDPTGEDNADEALYCISTGQVIPSNIAQDILNIASDGEKWFSDCRDGCFVDPSHFEKPIPRHKMKIFSPAVVTTILKIKDKKILEVKGTSDLFGCLLYLAAERQVNLLKVFSYPLIPVPLSLSQLDGAMNKTDKAKLMHALEDRMTSNMQHATISTTPNTTVCLHPGCNVSDLKLSGSASNIWRICQRHSKKAM